MTTNVVHAELSWLVTEDIESLICPIRELLLDQGDSESCFMLQQQSALAILGEDCAKLVIYCFIGTDLWSVPQHIPRLVCIC